MTTEDQDTTSIDASDIVDPTSHENRRIQPRKEFNVEVGVYAEYQFYTGMTSNISTGGLFIATNEPLDIGQTFDLSFKIPTVDHSFKCSAEVRWIRSSEVAGNSEMNAGMGVRFIGLDDMEQKLIDQFIHGEDTLFFDDE